jgi:hypothetical protein
MNVTNNLTELFRRCVVRVIVGHSSGTGFFVSPGFVITCSHVVNSPSVERGNTISIIWNQVDYPAEVLNRLPEEYPDLALLRVTLLEHPCVYLDESLEVGTKLYIYGHPDDYPDGDSTTVEFEGFTGYSKILLKLKGGQIRPGLSGSPILNLSSGGVCGVLKKTRHRSTDLGGRAIPISKMLFDGVNLQESNQLYHQKDSFG